MNSLNLSQLDWQKMGGLIPAIIQDASNGRVLMLGYMNQEALDRSLETKQLTFYSRSKQRLWQKGETSGNTMCIQTITMDCDGDSLLVQVKPEGPACHLGLTSCFHEPSSFQLQFLSTLMAVIQTKSQGGNIESYCAQLIASGVPRCAQKLGEEAVETAIAATLGDAAQLINEAADLLFHFLVLLQASGVSFYSVLACLEDRHTG
ncbi:bifunctional phosphoribosyl-AMP cyclohydrolase/phosphoribosyl-ATP diphosphatase HisIE [Legionella jordanis]|uniref:bifunctional phosphoribosyl-AMP cyclohydrolase/phosphoribosyl-ATP diphosphatase HisIE n=1 Tax=Legionella jordanis TaxID=456 RepID=UPI000EFFD606|nr:bifunctional phosphoribosyl-AMP cyclohydrolase/phosphoribosyl-ATP diphosphatase HisIE [Legionella jordanis]RMX18753.1 bifunctional phosphoribosyl-AMP cyclohydrolase/phosphoribosyl-ATP diphosphatase HisIE [Legionella jordanis]